MGRFDHVVDLASFDVPLEHEPCVAIVLTDQRLAGLEHEEESAGRVDQRNAAVEREVDLAVVFVPRAAKLSDETRDTAAQIELGEERARLRLRHENRRARELQRADPVQHRRLEDDASFQPARHQKPALPESGGRENLNPLAAVGGVGDDEAAVGGDGERGGVDDAARLRADLHDLPRARLLGVDTEDRMRAPVEDEVLTRIGLLEADRGTKASGDVRGNRAARLQDLWRSRIEDGDRRDDDERDSRQYRAVSLMALRMSGVCGRMASSSSG